MPIWYLLAATPNIVFFVEI